MTTSAVQAPLGDLSATYAHMRDLLLGYERDPRKLKEGQAAITGWIAVVDRLRSMIECRGEK